MDWTLGLGVGLLVYLAFVFDLFGFLARDELWLRLLMLAASALYLVYYFVVADSPLWDALITNAALAAVNLAMIAVVILERTTFTMTPETAALYRSFSMLTPGQFRRLMRLAENRTSTQETALTTQGALPKHLWFIAEGEAQIEKDGHATALPPRIFIGEISYLRGGPATATVIAPAGARLISWSHADLARLTKRHPALQVAMVAQFNSDLIAKVAGSQPAGQINPIGS